jgi:hypothetical protein
VAVLAIGAITGSPSVALAKFGYTFEGDLKVKLSDGTTESLRGVQIRVKRQGGTGAGRKSVQTSGGGYFKGTWQFTRDRDGRLPGRKDIRFEVQARLRNNALKIRKGGWFKNNWITVATPRGKDGQDFSLGDVVISGGKKEKLAGIWWANETLLRRLNRRNVGLTRRLTVIYPNKFVFKPNANFYLFKVRLTEDRGDVADLNNTETIIHEAMHQWDVNHMKGEASLLCVADAHHKPPEKWASSRCSGFMEGFAQATAEQLNNRVFNADYFDGSDGRDDPPVPRTMWDLRNGRGVSYQIQNLSDAQTTDDGWENFLNFIMTEDKFRRFNNVPEPSCKPKTVPIWETLTALKQEAPRKSNWFKGKATFSWFTDILSRRVNGFGEWDARYYERLGDPSNRLTEIQAALCNGNDAASGSGATVSMEYGYNRGGSDYRNFTLDSPEPKTCRQACAGEDRCQAFTYVPPGRQGAKARCWLKDSVPGRNPSEGLVSGVKGTDPIHAVTIERNYNRGGSDYRNFTLNDADPSICRQACADENQCAAYTYVPPGRQGPKARCWLKDSAPSRSSQDGLFSGVKQ